MFYALTLVENHGILFLNIMLSLIVLYICDTGMFTFLQIIEFLRMRNYGEVLAKFETEKEATCPFLFAPSHTQFLVYCNLSTVTFPFYGCMCVVLVSWMPVTFFCFKFQKSWNDHWNNKAVKIKLWVRVLITGRMVCDH